MLPATDVTESRFLHAHYVSGTPTPIARPAGNFIRGMSVFTGKAKDGISINGYTKNTAKKLASCNSRNLCVVTVHRLFPHRFSSHLKLRLSTPVPLHGRKFHLKNTVENSLGHCLSKYFVSISTTTLPQLLQKCQHYFIFPYKV